MDRLTEHHVNKTLGAYMACSMACIDDDFDCNNCEKLAEMVDRLAAYEDTGLSPETVSDLLERFHSLYEIFDDLDLVDRVHFQAFLERVRRWHQAKKDGRLVVMPSNDSLVLEESGHDG